MYAIILNDSIIGFTDEKIDNEIMQFDELVKGNFDLTKQYIYENGKVKEDLEFYKKQKLLQVEQIKQKYSSIILAKYSLTDQLNMTNEALMINTIANIEQREFTDSEKLRFQEIEQAKVFIDEQRELCKKEIETFLKS